MHRLKDNKHLEIWDVSPNKIFTQKLFFCWLEFWHNMFVILGLFLVQFNIYQSPMLVWKAFLLICMLE